MVGTGEVVQDAPTQVEQAPTPKKETTIQENSNVQDTTNSVKPEPQKAPKVESTTVKETPKQSSSSNGSVQEQIKNAGGNSAVLEIARRESTFNPNAVNPAGYRGLFQTKESFATGSVEQQTKGAIKYMNDRYGSPEQALAHHDAVGWY